MKNWRKVTTKNKENKIDIIGKTHRNNYHNKQNIFYSKYQSI